MRIVSIFRGAALATVTTVALAGCSVIPVASEADQQACQVYAVAQNAYLATSAAIAEVAADPQQVTAEMVTQFEERQAQLLATYDSAIAMVESTELKAAFENAKNIDGAMYADLANASDQQIQDSMAAAATLVSTCLVSGVDIAQLLNG